MKKPATLTYEFVQFIPEKLEERTLYVSIDYGTVVHKCCCGCGSEVVTPLGPTDWKLTYDGISISLYPSIGNWSLECKSHYWIDRNTVEWAEKWSVQEIEAGRARNRRTKEKYYTASENPAVSETADDVEKATPDRPWNGIWSRLIKWWSR